MSDAPATPATPEARYVPPAPPTRRPAVKGHVAAIVGCSILLAACMLLDADAQQVSMPGVGKLPELCMMKRTIGLACPGCGLTRCFVLIGHGRFVEAWLISPMGVVFFALVALQIPLQSIQLAFALRGRDELIGYWSSTAVVVVAILLIVQWFWRLALWELPA